MIVYNKNTNRIVAVIPTNQNIETFFYHYPQDFKNNLASIEIKHIPKDIENYKIINNNLIRMSDVEILETQIYGKILTEEERQLQKLKPSPEEVKKPEQTIEILTLIQEVI